MKIIKEIKRNIKFNSRKPTSKYRCKYGDRTSFDILRITISLDNDVKEIYEIDAKFLPETDSIYFNAKPTEKGFEIFGWTAVIAPFVRKVEN